MTQKNWKKNTFIMEIFILILKRYILPMFQNTNKACKTTYSFDDFERIRMALYCSNKTMMISIKRSNNGVKK